MVDGLQRTAFDYFFIHTMRAPCQWQHVPRGHALL
jgi:hypothetical protein